MGGGQDLKKIIAPSCVEENSSPCVKEKHTSN
jgi:hypothetical protein